LPKDKRQPLLRLKNGKDVLVRKAYVVWDSLTSAQTKHPEHFEALVAIARNQENSVTSSLHNELRRHYLHWFTAEGQLLPIVRDIIESSWRETPDGITLVNPFHLANQNDVNCLTEVEERDRRFLERLFRRRDEPPDQPAR
jgi:hypothetical protein